MTLHFGKTYWELEDAVDLCVAVEEICQKHGCHVALTGGVLYKAGPRKDLDLVFYRIRQAKEIDVPGLMGSLSKLGIVQLKTFGWVTKARFDRRSIDLLFPESKGSSEDY